MGRKATIENVDSATFEGTQKIIHQRHVRINGVLVRVDCQRGNRDEYSHARAYVWSPTALQWNFLYALPANQLRCVLYKVSYVTPLETHPYLRGDADEVIEMAAELLRV
jgi:hypothetical protein